MNLDPPKKTVRHFFNLNPHIRWGLLAIIVIIFITGLYPGILIKNHQYDIGDVALSDIKASEAFFIEDRPASETLRRQAADRLLPVYDLDPKVAIGVIKRLNDAFDQQRFLYEQKSDRPDASSRVKPSAPADDTGSVPDSDDVLSPAVPPHEDRMTANRKLFETTAGIRVEPHAFSILIQNQFSKQIPALIAAIANQIFSNGVVADKNALLQNSEKGITLRDLETQSETHLLQLKGFYGPDQAKTMVRIVGDPLLKNVNVDLLNVIVDFSRQLLQPNIFFNDQETKTRKLKAAEQIQPIRTMIKKGEMLVREGERVTPLQYRKIRAMADQVDSRRLPFASIGAVVLLSTILIVQYQVRLKGSSKRQAFGNKDLLFLASVMIAFMVVVKIAASLPDAWFLGQQILRPSSSVGFGIPLAAGAMIVCLIMGLDTALIFSLALSLCATMLLQEGLETFIFFILSCTMASWWLQDCRERRIIIKAGAKLGLMNGILAAVIDIYLGTSAWVTLPADMIVAFLGGFAAGIITAGMAPLVEWVFDYTTDITLLELANLDRPILRRLMVEAPGTYHHSVIVGSMVEAAAAAIDANPILAKVCGYYHDIGKLKQPLYFIENQSDGKNKHDQLTPSMSALILIAHVKNGVELARDNQLGRVIVDTIEQHHGTSLIRFFYDKATLEKPDSRINIDDFRYPGPRPQTREAGLVMLADVLEAASRTLENPTPSRIQGLVRNLINQVFSDGQLDHCELTLKDLHLIANSFTKILNGIHHHRIEYRDSADMISGKKKHGRRDSKSPTPIQIAR
jgi:putative nucleotidyltransferase with HDIG domain